MTKRILKMGDPAALDHPRRTQVHRQMILGKSFLHNLYQEWYTRIVLALPAMEGYVVEIGSGGGFLKEILPKVILLDVLSLPHLDVIADAQALPFRRGCLRGMAMVNVLHHIATPARFFHMASHCIRPGGVITMIEPWSTTWSRFVYKHLHYEPFLSEEGWTFSSTGPLSSANAAMPWILFHRDLDRFHIAFPTWRVEQITGFMPFAYLASGGLSYPSLLPGSLYSAFRWMETRLNPWARYISMFAHITLRRTDDTEAKPLPSAIYADVEDFQPFRKGCGTP